MYSWLVTVLLLASAAYCSGGARVPLTSYVCTQPEHSTFSDVNQCSVTSGLRTCETKEGVHPNLLNGDTTHYGVYIWKNNTNPFVVLDIPQGWCVGSVEMTFLITGGIPTLSLSVHSAERLSTNTSRTMYSTAHNRLEGGTRVVMNLAKLTCGRYLRINMTSDRDLYLTEIEVFGTSKILSSTIPGPNSTLSFPASIATSGYPVSPTTSVSLSTYPVVQDNYVLPAAISVVAVLLVVVMIAIFVAVIYIVTHRHKTWKSLKVQHLPIHYRSTQSDVTFGDSQFPVSQSAEVSTHVDKSHGGEIKDAPHNNTALGPSASPNTPVYGNVGPPSSSPLPAAAQSSKHRSPPKPLHLAKSPSVPQEDHIYTEMDKSHKTSASSTSSPPANLTHSTDATQVDGTNASTDTLYDDLCGGSGNVEGNDMRQPESITSSTTSVGAVPTQTAAMGIIYTEVDYSKKKSRRGEES